MPRGALISWAPAALALFLVTAHCAAASEPIFTLTEHFGASNPRQPVEVNIDDATHDLLASGTKHIVGPDGLEVPFQLLASKKLLVSSSLPASPRSHKYAITGAAPDTDHIFTAGNRHTVGVGYPITLEEVKDGAPLPAGLNADTVYFVKDIEYEPWYNYPLYRLVTSPDLTAAPVDITEKGDAILTAYAMIITGIDTSTFYRPDHQYFTGMPFVFDDASPVTLPSPLAAGVTYYVIRVDKNHFQLALSADTARSNTKIVLTDVTSGQLVQKYEGWVRLPFTMADGAPTAQHPHKVVVTPSSATELDITNGLTGVRVLVENDWSSGAPILSFIQGIRGADSQWYADSGAATLRLPSIYETKYNLTVATDIISNFTFEMLESGPLLTRVRATYTTRRPYYGGAYPYPITAVDVDNDILTVFPDPDGLLAFQFHPMWLVSVGVAEDGELPCGIEPNTVYSPHVEHWDATTGAAMIRLWKTPHGPPVDITCTGNVSVPNGATTLYVVDTTNFAGTGFFTQEVALYAGTKSVLITDDFDTELQYFVNLYKTGSFEPTMTRYRGFGSPDVSCGYTVDAVSGEKTAPTPFGFVSLDALRPIGDYAQPRVPQSPSGIVTCGEAWSSAPTWYMGLTGISSGYYWLMYDDRNTADSSSPMFGYYIGHLSSYLQTLNVGPSVYTAPHHEDNGYQRAAGFTNYFFFNRADGSKTSRSRKQWAIYAGTKGELTSVAETQAIGKERHALVGINLSSMLRYQLEFESPPSWPAIGGDENIYAANVLRLKTDDDFRKYLESYAATAPMTPLIEMLRNTTPSAIEGVVRSVEMFAFQVANIMANGDGAFDKRLHFYTMIADWQAEAQHAVRIVLKDDAGLLTPSQEARLKACIAYVHGIVWDTDFMPYDREVYEEAGNPNQNALLIYQRAQAALVLPTHPVMSNRLDTARKMVLDYFNGFYVGTDGAPRGGTWYQQPGTNPALWAMLEFGNYNDTTPFERLHLYGQWYLSAVTPVEPQIGGGRKIVALGDGSTFSNSIVAVLATLLRRIFGPADEVAGQLQWLWRAFETEYSKEVHDYALGPSFLVIDASAAPLEPNLPGRDYPGYWTAIRQSQKTPEETALWLIKGPFYSDHRHHDMGHVTIYALSAPLCVDWTANINNPPTPIAYLHNKVLFNSSLPGITISRWDEDGHRIRGGEYDPYFYGWDFNPVSPSTSLLDLVGASYSSITSGLRETMLMDFWTRAVTLVTRKSSQPIIYVHDSFTGPKALDFKVITWWVEADGSVEAPNGTLVTPPPRYFSPDAKIREFPSATPKWPFPEGDFGRFGFTGNHYRMHRAGGIDFDVHIHAGAKGSAAEYVLGAFSVSALSGREEEEAYLMLNKSQYIDQQYVARVHSTSPVMQTVMLPVEKGQPRSGTVRAAPCGSLVRRGNLGDRACFNSDGYSYADGTTASVTLVSGSSVQLDSTVDSSARIRLSGGPGEVICQLARETVAVRLMGPPGTRMVEVRCHGANNKYLYRDGSGTVLASGNTFEFEHDSAGVTEYELTLDPSVTRVDPYLDVRSSAGYYNGLVVDRRDGKVYACRHSPTENICMMSDAGAPRKWKPLPKIAGTKVWIRAIEVHSGLVFGTPAISEPLANGVYVLRGTWVPATLAEKDIYMNGLALDRVHIIPGSEGEAFEPLSFAPLPGGFSKFLRATRKGVGQSTTPDGDIAYTLVFDCNGIALEPMDTHPSRRPRHLFAMAMPNGIRQHTVTVPQNVCVHEAVTSGESDSRDVMAASRKEETTREGLFLVALLGAVLWVVLGTCTVLWVFFGAQWWRVGWRTVCV